MVIYRRQDGELVEPGGPCVSCCWYQSYKRAYSEDHPRQREAQPAALELTEGEEAG